VNRSFPALPGSSSLGPPSKRQGASLSQREAICLDPGRSADGKTSIHRARDLPTTTQKQTTHNKTTNNNKKTQKTKKTTKNTTNKKKTTNNNNTKTQTTTTTN
jgi:hypothetical protein